MAKECEHNFKGLYYRKKVNGGNTQGWFKLKDFLVCDKCFKIIKQEVKTKEVKG